MLEFNLCATIEKEIEIISVGVTRGDFQRFLDQNKALEYRERYTPILWTQELDEKYTSEPKFLVKNGKRVDG